MAPTYDVGCENVKWEGPIAVFEALQTEIDRRLLNADTLSVLDLGTGHGQLGDLFKKSRHGNTHVTGVDIAEKMLKEAVEKQHIDIAIHGNAEEMSWALNGEFDIVTCVGVLDFIYDTPSFAGEVTRVLKPGGFFGFNYEPQGTEFPGVESIKHHTQTLQRQFERNGAKILTIQERPEIFTNFRTGIPVTNNIMIGTMPG